MVSTTTDASGSGAYQQSAKVSQELRN